MATAKKAEAKTLEELQAIVEEQSGLIKALQKQLKDADQSETIKTLQAEVKELKNPTPAADKKKVKVELPTKTFKVNKKEYRFIKTHYRNRANNIVKSESALGKPAELEWLVAVDAANIEAVK